MIDRLARQIGDAAPIHLRVGHGNNVISLFASDWDVTRIVIEFGQVADDAGIELRDCSVVPCSLGGSSRPTTRNVGHGKAGERQIADCDKRGVSLFCSGRHAGPHTWPDDYSPID